MKLKRLFTAVILGAALTAGYIYMNDVRPARTGVPSVEVFEPDGFTGNISVISFSSPYCAACKKQKQELETLQSELSGEAVFKMVDVTKDRQTPGYYGVSSVPTILITYKGMEVGRFSGLQKAESLESEIKKQIEKHRYCEDGSIC